MSAHGPLLEAPGPERRTAALSPSAVPLGVHLDQGSMVATFGGQRFGEGGRGVWAGEVNRREWGSGWRVERGDSAKIGMGLKEVKKIGPGATPAVTHLYRVWVEPGGNPLFPLPPPLSHICGNWESISRLLRPSVHVPNCRDPRHWSTCDTRCGRRPERHSE